MIFYYNIVVHYQVGKQYIERKYKKSFCEIGKFFIWLEQKHKDNYTIFKIEPIRK
jgi:hypothetical protein